jgi:DHA1 family bicyclomycin/chloramphenicol resistance-like MFS transporter
MMPSFAAVESRNVPRSRSRIRPESLAFLLLLSALGGMTPLSIDMGLPALGAIGSSLRVPIASAGLTLSFFLCGFAFGPLLLGPLSDRYGRRPVLLAGSALFAIGGIGCALSSSLTVLLGFRLIQGLGGGAGATLSLAIVRDHFDGQAARVRLSYVGTVGTLAPMIAPTLGAIILGFLGWRCIYGFLAVAGLLLVAAIAWGFEESHRALDATALRPLQLLRNYARVWQHPVTRGYALINASGFGMMFAYISSSSLVMMNVFGLSPAQYGWTFAATAFGIMSGAFVNGRLSARGVSASRLLTFGLTISLVLMLALIAVSHSRFAAVRTILPLLVLNTFCSGLVGPNATQGVMHHLPEIAGVASAMLGASRMFVGAFSGVLVSLIFDGRSAHAMAEIMGLFSAFSWAAYFFLVRPAERLPLFPPKNL